MTNSKYAEDIKMKTRKRIETLRAEANEAFQNYSDTGYQRYIDKQERLLAEAEKLEEFINPGQDIRNNLNMSSNDKAKAERLTILLKSVQNVVEDMKWTFPDCMETRRLEEIIWKFKEECND